MTYAKLNRFLAPMLGVTSILALAACASPGPSASPGQRAAIHLSRSGAEAYLEGRPKQAETDLAAAVRAFLAAGDLPGAARALLNLALAQRGAHETEAATATAGRLHDLAPAAEQQADEQRVPGEARVASAWLEALLATDRADFAAAAAALDAASGNFPKSSPWPARLTTLRAEIAQLQGKSDEAAALARSGTAAASAIHDVAEEARARRIAGAALMALGKWTEARTELLTSVRLEEKLGGGARMAGDLENLARIADHDGDPTAADLYRRRAQAITGHTP